MNCSHCKAQVHDGTSLCDRCVKTFDIALTNIAGDWPDLETLRTHAKAVRYDRGGGKGGTKSRPLGVDLRFVRPSNAAKEGPDAVPGREGRGTELVHAARNALVGWTRILLEDYPPACGPVCGRPCLHRSCAEVRRRAHPRDTIPAVCYYLQGHLSAIAASDWAGEALTEACRIERELTVLLDIPPVRWYAGRCGAGDDSGNECTAEVYAIEDDLLVRCPACGTEHDVQWRRDVLLEEAKNYHVTATEAASALVAWTDLAESDVKLVDRIRKWADRRRIEVVGHVEVKGQERRLYRLGDVQALLVEAAQREQERVLTRTGRMSA